MEVDKQRIAELVCKIQSGDNSVFEELYKLTSERAYFVALEFTKNNQDAEDILQESYIKALSKINELDKPESFSSWLNQIVANKSKDFLKKKKPVLFEEDENEVFDFIPDEDTSFSPEGNLDQTELQRTVMEVLDELSEDKRACVLMMYFEELSVGEIAETLEIPEGTVKTRLFSARKDLKEKFAKRGITSTFSFAPIGVVIWAMQRASETVSKSFAASGASAKVLTGITVAGSGTAAAGAATGGAAATAATIGSTATAASTAATGTGIAAKIAALTVAQKVIAGVSVAAVVAGSTAGVATVVNNSDKKDDISTTAYTEEYTTAPSFETTLAVEAIGTVEFSETTQLQSEESGASQTEKTSVTAKTSAVSTSQKPTEGKTATTTRRQRTTKAATTNVTETGKQTTAVTTAKEETTTAKQTTTRKPTTTKASETRTTTVVTEKETTKAATTAVKLTGPQTTVPTTTEPTTVTTTKGKATVNIEYMVDGSDSTTSVTHQVDEGSTVNNAYVRNYMKTNYGFSTVIVDLGEETDSAVANETYDFSVSCA